MSEKWTLSNSKKVTLLCVKYRVTNVVNNITNNRYYRETLPLNSVHIMSRKRVLFICPVVWDNGTKFVTQIAPILWCVRYKISGEILLSIVSEYGGNTCHRQSHMWVFRGKIVAKSWLNSHLNKLRHLVCESCSNWATETRINTGFVGGLWQNVQIEHFFTPFFFPECSLKNQHKCWHCDISPYKCLDLRYGKKKGIRGGDAIGPKGPLRSA